MKFSLALAGLLIATTAATAMAKDGPYIEAQGGTTIVHNSDVTVTGLGTGNISYDAGGCFVLSAGGNIGNSRFEGEFGYKNASIRNASSADITVLSYMANAFYDFKNESATVPFIGAGLGLLNGEIKANGASENANTFGYQFMVGLGYKATEHVTIDLTYKFQGAASDFSKDNVNISFQSSNILAGLRYNF